MTAPTQTTSTGWYYADANPSVNRNAWDGRLWPEITGYRGHDIEVVEEIELVDVEVDHDEVPAKPKVKPPRLFEVVEMKNAGKQAPVALPAQPEILEPAFEPVVESVTAAKSSMRLILALVLALIVIALILGVAL